MKVKVFYLTKTEDGTATVVCYSSKAEMNKAITEVIRDTDDGAPEYKEILALLDAGNLDDAWEQYRNHMANDGIYYMDGEDYVEVSVKGLASRRIKQLEKALADVREMVTDRAIDLRSSGADFDSGEDSSPSERFVTALQRRINKTLKPRHMYDVLAT